jgi:hypothetical protein
MVFALAWLLIGLLCVYGAVNRKEYSGFILAWGFFLFAVSSVKARTCLERFVSTC